MKTRSSSATATAPPACTAYLGLGGNLGDVLATLARALTGLAAQGVTVVSLSSAYRTQALQPFDVSEPVPDYWNAACGVTTSLAPHELLLVLHEIEARLGRVRRERWASRTVDLDLLLYGEQSLALPDLIVPHPGIAQRLFVLRPLCEIAGDARIPPEGLTVQSLLARHASPDTGIYECRTAWHPLCGPSRRPVG